MRNVLWRLYDLTVDAELWLRCARGHRWGFGTSVLASGETVAYRQCTRCAELTLDA